MCVAAGAAGLLILPAFLAGPVFFVTGPSVPKLRNRPDPFADPGLSAPTSEPLF